LPSRVKKDQIHDWNKLPLWVIRDKAIKATPRRLSALPPKADMRDLSRRVRFVPKAD